MLPGSATVKDNDSLTPACRCEITGAIRTGSMHPMALKKLPPIDDEELARSYDTVTDGFVTEGGEFLTREEAQEYLEK